MVIRNELPPTIRQRNILVPFLFRKHGEVDFSDNLLKILRDDLNNLNQNGLQWWDPNGNENRTQIVPYCLCTDSMMKYKLLGIKSVTIETDIKADRFIIQESRVRVEILPFMTNLNGQFQQQLKETPADSKLRT